jgi:hypothetical protein
MGIVQERRTPLRVRSIAPGGAPIGRKAPTACLRPICPDMRRMWHSRWRMSPARRPRTPQLAEGLFENLCLTAGLTANRSHDDQFGWDFLVQFPSLRLGGPADLDPAGATCLVQIKSTRKGKATTRVKLSNALRFAQESLPCFLVLLSFDGDLSTPDAAWVRHFWTDDIGASLKAVRQAHVDEDEALHRLYYAIRFTDLERCDLSAIAARIEAIVAEIGADYSAQKAAFTATVGYEDGYAVGKFTFDETVSDEAFIDMMLGRIADLPVSSIVMRDNRFGLPGPILIPDRPARMSIIATPHRTCQVIVGPADGSAELTLDGEIFIPGVPGLSEDLFRFRVQTRLLELIVRMKGESALTVSYDADAPLAIQEIAEQARFLSWVYSGPLNLGVWVGGSLLNQGTIQLHNSSSRAPWRRLAEVLEQFLALVPAQRWPADARFNVRDLMSGLETLETFSAQLTQPGIRLGIGVTAPNFLDTMKRIHRYLAPVYLDFGEATLFAALEASIERIDEDDRGIGITLSQPKIYRRAILAGGAEANLAFMQGQFTAVREEHGGGADVMIGTLGDIERER